MTVSTSLYESSHGHKPRGRGLWAFLIERRPGEYTEFWSNGSYTEAIRACKVEARQIGGVSRIIPQP